MLTLIRGLFVWLPGEIEKEVNLITLAEVVGAAEIANPGVESAIQAVIANQARIFHDDVYGKLAVRILTHVSNMLSHASTDPARPAAGA